ncbi:MAG: cation:proton antiporter [Lentisphaeria bacterium]|nr:cation:proton antiporter [Lentisphaeria bacterium]
MFVIPLAVNSATLADASATMAATAAELTKVGLVQDLAAVMLVAGLVAAFFHYMGWPKVIGYISAGVLMGMPPFKQFMISNEASINVLASLGIIFLMFTLGLELNIRRLRKIGTTVFPTAVFDMAMMILIGYAIGRHVFAWSWLPSLVLGVMICDSSTTLLAKSLEEMGCSRAKFAVVIFGTTITEDVLTIGVMAILTGLFLTGQFQAMELARQLGYLSLFLVGVMVFGILLLPRFLDRLSRLKDDETLQLIVLGICFGIAFVAEKLNFSLALGAFLVGAVISESKVLKRVHEHSGVLRSMFSAVFFVTVGLMVNPGQMWDNAWQILLLVLLVLACKTVNCFLGALISGQTFRESLLIGVGLAQLGDFSYLVALLAIDLATGAEPYQQLYQLAVGVSIITTLLNPFLLKKTMAVSDALQRFLPPTWQEVLDNYHSWVNRTRHQVAGSRERGVLTKHGLFLLIDIMLIAVVFWIAAFFKEQDAWWAIFPDFVRGELKNHLLWLASCAFCFPIAVSAFLHGRKAADDLAATTVPVFLDDRWAGPLRRFTRGGVMIFCAAVVALELGVLSVTVLGLAPLGWLVMILFYIVACLFAWTKVKRLALEGQSALKAVLEGDEVVADPDATMSVAAPSWSLQLPQSSAAIGMTLAQLHLRNRTGATITRIARNNQDSVDNPGPETVLQEGDTLTIRGTEKQFQSARDLLSQTEIEEHTMPVLSQIIDLHVEAISIPKESSYAQKKLADVRLRNQTGVTVVRIERQGQALPGPPGPDDRICADDRLFVLGSTEQIEATKAFFHKQETEFELI